MNIDRDSRNRLVATIDRYLDEQITAFQFDDEINVVWDATDDPTVEYVAGALWYHYDDCKDHNVNLTKEEWDYFQRLILLLESDSHIQELRTRKWSVTQLIAAAALLLFSVVIAWLGFGLHLFVAALPFGVVSVILCKWRSRSATIPSPMELALTPFVSVAELLTVRRRTGRFSKRKYPGPIGSKRIRSPMMDRAMMVPTYAMWLLFSPLVLLCQLLPETDCETRVVTP